ncbi:MAG: hypothetical protein AB8H03_26470 [Saprospiraceae bacterium]
MKSKERIKLEKGDWLNYYKVSLLQLMPIFMFIYLFLKYSDIEALYFIIFFLLLFSFFYWINWNRLFFQELIAEVTHDEFERSIKATAHELDWQIIKLEDKYAEIIRHPNELSIGGEKITIKRKIDRLLINSMANPKLHRSGYSRKRNKENVNSYLRNIGQILTGQNVEENITKRKAKEEKEFWEGSEWTIGNLLMRIIGYGLTLIFLFIGIAGIYEGLWLGVFPIILSIGLSLNYIKSDIEIIREKNRRKKLKK